MVAEVVYSGVFFAQAAADDLRDAPLM